MPFLTENENCMLPDTIQNAYRLTGSNDFYDGMIICSTLSGKRFDARVRCVEIRFAQ